MLRKHKNHVKPEQCNHSLFESHHIVRDLTRTRAHTHVRIIIGGRHVNKVNKLTCLAARGQEEMNGSQTNLQIIQCLRVFFLLSLTLITHKTTTGRKKSRYSLKCPHETQPTS